MTDQALAHLRRLSTIRSGKNVKFLSPAVYTGGYCPMRVACNIAEEIEGLSYLIIGMPECATHSRRTNAQPEGPGGELQWMYVLDANEVVFGCREGIVDALRQMDQAGARAILMIATCVTDLIGEDFEGIVSELEPELGARLSYVTLGQFKNFSSQIGTWKTAEALGALMLPKPTVAKRANAILIEPWRNINEEVAFPLVVGALADLGVEVRALAAGATLEDYMDAPDAALNLVLCPYTQPLAASMQERFGIPYAPLHNAYTVADIDAAYEMIAEAFDISWDGCFDAWRAKAVELEERARRELQGLRFAVLSGLEMPVAFALYLTEFGMEPLLIHIDDFHNEDLGYAQQLKARGFDPPACRLMYIERDIELIRKMQPDISFGYIRDPIEGFCCMEEMGDFLGMCGYERTVAILTMLFNVLETGQPGERIDIYGPAPL